MLAYFLCFILFSIGIYCILVKRNLVKKIIGLGISEYALNLFFILLGYRKDAQAPIFDRSNLFTKNFVDPLPQALVLTSIVIGLAVTALMVALAIKLYEKYQTFDMEKIRRLRG